ncbi:MAG: hypothetical protein M0R66_07720 [Candidatus Omnitrophica bacterium]|nr:hypothetical protein [Candidatus Omnitrophota bacterium]
MTTIPEPSPSETARATEESRAPSDAPTEERAAQSMIGSPRASEECASPRVPPIKNWADDVEEQSELPDLPEDWVVKGRDGAAQPTVGAISIAQIMQSHAVVAARVVPERGVSSSNPFQALKINAADGVRVVPRRRGSRGGVKEAAKRERKAAMRASGGVVVAAAAATAVAAATAPAIEKCAECRVGTQTYAQVVAPACATSTVRFIDPTPAQIYAALAACGIINTRDGAPPARFEKGSEVQVALWRAFYENPRGCECVPVRGAVRQCWKSTTACIYSKIIAIIYELAGASATRERIEAINFTDFSAIFGETLGMMGNHWFGVYPIYENARIHVATFSHQCDYSCPITNIQRELRNASASDRAVLQELATAHMMMYKHPIAQRAASSSFRREVAVRAPFRGSAVRFRGAVPGYTAPPTLAELIAAAPPLAIAAQPSFSIGDVMKHATKATSRRSARRAQSVARPSQSPEECASAPDAAAEVAQ